MPRIRSLKYEYFINEDLAQVSAEARLLGLGLTTVADREGRMEDRPMRLKVVLFPYHDVDVDALLNELESARFISRYQVAGQRFIAITNFHKHQKPHPKEQPSVIPSPEKVRSSREKKRQGLPSPTLEVTQGKPCKVVNGSGNGLGDLGSLVNGDGHVDSVGTGASATNEKSGGQEFTIWKLAVGKLMTVGMGEQDARSFLGAQCKTYSKDRVAEAITKMLAQEPADPKGYLVKVLQNGASNGAGTQTNELRRPTAAERNNEQLKRNLAVVEKLRRESRGNTDEVEGRNIAAVKR